MQQEIRQQWFFHRTPAEVWEYLTQPELLELWLGKTDFKPIKGQQFRFYSPYGNDSICEVLEVSPFTRLSYSWQKNSSKDNQPFYSVIVWTLVPKENGTELQLVHGGFTTVEDVAAHEKGWNYCAAQINKLLNTEK